jgi:hypothetical protein
MYLRATRAGKAAREETPSTSLPLSRSRGYGQYIMTSFPRLSRLEFASRFNSVGICRQGDFCFHFAAWVHVNTNSSAADAFAYAGGEQQEEEAKRQSECMDDWVPPSGGHHPHSFNKMDVVFLPVCCISYVPSLPSITTQLIFAKP